MKISILLSVMFCVFNIKTIAQSCLPGGAFFNTQEQVDNFSSANPGCLVVEGNVYVGSGIQNLLGLSVIKEIKGDFYITQTTQLSSLQGLEQLTEIHGAVRIQNNSALASLNALTKLSAIRGDYFYISDNPLLQNLQGLNALDSIGGIIHVNDMIGLKNLSGLENVRYIGDRMSIFRCDSLVSLDGLNGLSEVGAIDITDNHVLSSVQALDHPIQINAQLVVTDNPQLSNCKVEAFCDYFIDPPSFVVFNNNGNGCSDKVQLELECTSNSSYEINSSVIKVYPNPATDFLILDIPQNSKIYWIRMYNVQGKSVQTDIIQNRIDMTALNSGMHFGQVMVDEKRYHFSVIKN